MKNIWKLVISIVVPFVVSFIGGFFTASSVDTWYVELIKPSFNPPSWVFGPVWTVLFLLMGISFYLVWIKNSDKKVFFVFGVKLFLNMIWSILFFGLQNPLLAFVDILFLWGAIFLTIFYFYRINKISAYLLIPYILWVSFAVVLNLFIVILN